MGLQIDSYFDGKEIFSTGEVIMIQRLKPDGLHNLLSL